MDPNAFITELVEFVNKLDDSPDKINLVKMIAAIMSGKLDPKKVIIRVQGFIDAIRHPNYSTPTRRQSSIKIWEEVREIIKRHMENKEEKT